MVLKYVLEAAGSLPFMDCVRKTVLEPAGMTETWALVPTERTGDCVSYDGEYRIEGAKRICNLIRAEISGKRGEAIAFNSLRNLSCPHYILRNIELEDGTGRTEIDFLVITPKAIFII